MVIAAKGESRLEDQLSECRDISADTEDPLYGCQWHLKNTGQFIYSGKEITAGEDINIEGVWNEDVYGSGINVAVVSDGIDLSHEDLSANVDPGLSYNYSESVDLSDSSSFTGTRAAGVIAATGYNGLGVRGVAPGASIYSNELTGDNREVAAGDAMVRNKEITAVSVNDWGPEDKYSLAQASTVWEEGLELGISKGFYGKGVFYVRGAGDGHERGDQANFNEYSSYYGVTAVCSTDGYGKKSIFSEEGVNLWVCAPGSDIVTTDNNNDYVVTSGTVLSASQAGGVAALLREINVDLSWRDIKLILAGSARQNDFSDVSWETGAVKYGSDTERYKYNPKYGFGVVDAEAAAELAKSWKGVGEMRTVTASSDNELTIPDRDGEADGVLVSRLMIPDLEVTFTEFVEVELVFSHDRLQDLDIQITSPSGTTSELVREFSVEEEDAEISYVRRTHRFGSAKHLGEDPSGEWILNIADTASGDEEDGEEVGTLHSWSIKVYGNKKGDTAADLAKEITPKALTFGGATVQDQVYRAGTQITPLVLPEATGAEGITYSIRPAPPAGLNYNDNTRTISGTPTASQSNIRYQHIARDKDGKTTSVAFHIRVRFRNSTTPSFRETIPDQNYVTGRSITPLVFPRATGGDGQLSYSFDGTLNNLPGGLSLTSNPFRIIGTPSNAGTSTWQWTATDADGDTATLEFRIRIRAAADVPDFGDTQVRDQTFGNGRTISLGMPVADGGNGTLNYSITPALPNGLTYTSNNRQINGTINVSGQLPVTTTYTYKVTDSDTDTDDGDSDTLTFSFTIEANSVPNFGSQTVEGQVYATGQQVTLTLPLATGGNGNLSYSIIGALPSGLSFNPTTREISGTPTTVKSARTYTYRARDDDLDTDTITFSITITALSFDGQVPSSPVLYSAERRITPVTLPVATGGGTAPYTYSLTPRLPDGLSFNPTTRVISGTPTAATPLNTYTYTVTDSNGVTVEMTFDIAVRAHFSGLTIQSKVYTVGTAVMEMLPEATGHNGTVTYSLTPELPSGLDFTPATRVISGRPTATQNTRLYTYTDTTGTGGPARTLVFHITVRTEPNTMPTFGSETIDNKVYINGEAVNETLPEATSGNAPLTYSLSTNLAGGRLINGLSFNRNTRVLSGTPDLNPVPLPVTVNHTYKVRDNDGDTAEITFSITVEEDSEPDFSGVTIPDRVYTGRTIELPEAAGGNLPVTYSITPGLPAGLSFNGSTRRISGTPRSASTRTYTYTATDRNGDMDTLDFMFSVEVTSSPPPPNPRPAPDTEAGGGGCAVSEQSSVASDILGVMTCLILIPVSVTIRRKRRSHIKT